VQLENPDGSIAGDSGFCENQVSNLGFNQYLVALIGNIGTPKFVGFVALGSGTLVDAAGTALPNECMQKRAAVTAATTTGSKTCRFTATFASTASFATTTFNIANIGLFDASVTSAGTIFAGNTFASSSCAVNQNVNVTYDIVFS
jgi:hypothetical protein